MLPFSELPDKLREAAPLLGSERCSVAAATGRTLRAPATAAWDLPRFDNSAMDGYAVRAADTTAARPDQPVELDVIGDIFAGDAAAGRIPPGACRYITTGAAIPDGADAVIPIENVELIGPRIRLTEPVEPGCHIRRRGEECRAGEEVLGCGTVLTPWSIAALQSAGICEVTVARLPRISILATGSELVEPGATPGPGQVIETNAGLLQRALAATTPIEWRSIDRVVDDETALRNTIAAAADTSDLVITTGGVSIGRKDLVKDVATSLGFETILWKVAQKPGKPVYLARKGDTLLVGLPGNPAAVGVAIPVVLRPLLRLMSGVTNPFPRVLCRLAAPLKPERTRTRLHWATLDRNGHATALRRTGSHMLSDLGRADVLLIVPPGDTELEAGAMLKAVVLAV